MPCPALGRPREEAAARFTEETPGPAPRGHAAFVVPGCPSAAVKPTRRVCFFTNPRLRLPVRLAGSTALGHRGVLGSPPAEGGGRAARDDCGQSRRGGTAASDSVPRKRIAGADTGRRPRNVPKAERRLRGAWVAPREGAGAPGPAVPDETKCLCVQNTCKHGNDDGEWGDRRPTKVAPTRALQHKPLGRPGRPRRVRLSSIVCSNLARRKGVRAGCGRGPRVPGICTGAAEASSSPPPVTPRAAGGVAAGPPAARGGGGRMGQTGRCPRSIAGAPGPAPSVPTRPLPASPSHPHPLFTKRSVLVTLL